MAEDDEWTVGAVPAPRSAGTGPTASEWTIGTPPGANTPAKEPLGWGDAIKIGRASCRERVFEAV